VGGNGVKYVAATADVRSNSKPARDGALASLLQAAQSLDAWSLLRAIGRRWLLATILGSLAAAAAGAAAWNLLPTPYTAFAYIRISTQKPALLERPEYAGDTLDRQTQLALIRTPVVLNNALNRPEVANLSCVLEELDPMDWLSKELNVTIPGGELMRVSMSGEKPGELATLVNAVVYAYMSEMINTEADARIKRIQELEKVQQSTNDQLISKRKKMTDLGNDLGTIQSEVAVMKHKGQLELIQNLRTELWRNEVEWIKMDALLRTAEAKAGEDDEVPEATIERLLGDDRVSQGLQAKISQLERNAAVYAKTARSDDNPQLSRLRREIEAARTALDERRAELRPRYEQAVRDALERRENTQIALLKDQLKLFEDRKGELNARLEKEQESLKKTSKDTTELELLRKDMDQMQSIYDMAIKELQTMRVEMGAPNRGSVLSYAVAPRSRDTATRNKGTTLAAGGAFVGVVLLIGLLEWRAHRITSPVDVAREVGLRVVGTIPALLTDERIAPTTNGHIPRRVRRWYHVFEESFDVLRATLLYGSDGPPPRSLMVTSAHGQEGKTTLSAHVAASLARSGRNTLLIDADFRRPSLHTLFGVARQPGFTDVVQGRAELSQAIQPTIIPKLSLLTAGTVCSSLAEFLSDPRFSELLKRLPDQWDSIVVDAPPILPVSDGLILGQYVDGVVFTALSGVTGGLALQDAQDRLRAVGVRILGLVLMGFEPSSYYGYYVSRYYRRYTEPYAEPAVDAEVVSESDVAAQAEASSS
jgi:capsular exopolysaccharide synthesis family protein